MKDDKSRASKTFEDDVKAMMTQSLSTPTDFSSNSINDDFLMEPNVNRTFFRSLNYTLIVSQVGSFVQIPCRVHLIGDEMVKSLPVRNCFNYSFIIFHFMVAFVLPFRLHCVQKVSWIRRKDYHLLTVGLTTYSSDERFSVIHYEESEVNDD